jgi:DNA-damage-inducible protein J
MAANALVQTRIDPEVKEKAAAVLADIGLTVSDVVRIVLTRTANEGGLPFALQSSKPEQEAWFRARMQNALKDPAPDIPQEKLEASFAPRSAAALLKK